MIETARQVALLISQGIHGHFLLIWLAALALVSLWAFSRWTRPAVALPTGPSPAPPGTMDYFVGAGFFLFLAFYLIGIFYRADFADFDHSILSIPLLQNRDQYFPIWPRLGRFFPLGHQEFNVLRHVTRSVAGYHAFAAVELLVFLGIVFVLLREFRFWSRFAVLALVLSAPPILIAFMGLVYPERNLLLLIALLALCVQRWTDRPTAWPLFGALAATQFALYYKEPTFLLIFGFVATRLLCAWATPDAGQTRSVRRTLASHPLESGMLLLVGVFVALYSATMLPYQSLQYAATHPGAGSPMETLVGDLISDPLLVVFLLVLASRAVRLARTRTLPDPFWDALAVGGVLYLMAYVGLGMQASYFLSPVDFIAALYLAERTRLAMLHGRIRAIVPAAVAGLVVIPLAATSWLLTIRAKNIVHGRSQLAEFVRRQADTASKPIHLFFPYPSPYLLMEFGALLEWKGVRLTNVAGPGPRAVLESPHAFTDGRCVSYRSLPCTSASAPAPGTIVIVLPDDDTDDGPASLRPASMALFTYEPYAMAGAALPWLRRLRAVMAPGGRGTSDRRDWLWAYASIHGT